MKCSRVEVQSSIKYTEPQNQNKNQLYYSSMCTYKVFTVTPDSKNNLQDRNEHLAKNKDRSK